MYLPIILGTARKGRQSEKVARFMLGQVKKQGVTSEILDVRDYRVEATDASGKSDEAKKMAEKIKRADALIIVSPEYNHGYPGELKMMLDMLYEEYFYKPIGFAGVSAGKLGGARMVEQLRLVSIELHMIPIREALYFGEVEQLFDEDGEIRDKSFFEKVDKFLDQLKSLV